MGTGPHNSNNKDGTRTPSTKGNGYNNNFDNSFSNQPSLKDLVLGQTKSTIV